MIKVPVFVCFVIVAVCGLYVIALTPPNKNPFAGTNGYIYPIDFGVMASPTVAALKLRHAENHAPFAFGLFGNSRMLMIDAQSINRATEHFFNFALSSESLSGSVLLAKRLQYMGNLPQTVVFGLDNLHLQRDNVPIWPSFWTRVSHAIKSIKIAVADTAVITAARRTWRFIWGEAIRFKNNFGPTLVRAGIDRAFNQTTFEPAAPGTSGYLSDGSHTQTVRAEKIIPSGRTTSRLDVDLFRRNLESLGAFTTAGHTVIVVETPIYPKSQRRLDMDVPDYVQASRVMWREACIELQLTCIDAPIISDTHQNPWPDETHPPKEPWAKFVGEVISGVQAEAQH